jgi:transketolase
MHRDGPVALILTRQKVAVVDRTKYAPAAGLHKGGYVLADSPNPDVVLMATGSEVELILGAYERLKADGRRPRAVSMPCLEYFAKQSQSYRDSVLPPGVRRIAVEAAVPQPWYRWVGEKGVIIGIERFGESAPYQRVYKEFGLTVERIVAEA